ncbi:MAG TPA: ATP-binding protein [Planctomycetota bacterium]|nr:ATP-binding protein [Planctomycetota bacterium]
MKLPFKSLTTRIVCAVALILAAAGGVIGTALYRSFRHAETEELKAALSRRLTWLQASVELDEEGNLEVEPRQPLASLPQHWRVTLPDGRMLWQYQWDSEDSPFMSKTVTLVLGDANGKPLDPSEIKPNSSPGKSGPFPSYSTGKKHAKLDVRVDVRESSARLERELQRLALALWTIGPASILALVVILGLFIRWQLKPLGAMSKQASVIGPANTDVRIEPAGSSVELTRLRESINAMVERLAKGMARERQFSAMAAHELRTPLTQLRLSIEIALNKERENAEYKETLRQALIDIERLQKLVGNLLFLTRAIDSSELRGDVALEKVVAHAIKSCGSHAAIDSNLQALHAAGNQELLESAVRNVLENAAHYAPGEPPHIRAESNGTKIHLSISDCGPGVPEKDRERIFEPLTRLDEARSIGAEPEGFGLGLTVARYAVRACGGELICKARSDGKNGAVFEFTLAKAS